MDIDVVSPTTIGEDRIKVSLAATSLAPKVGGPCSVDIDYSDTAPEGTVAPIVISVQPPDSSGADYRREVFVNAPRAFTFYPSMAGEYLVLVRESAHNRWQGRLLVTVSGDNTSNPLTGSERGAGSSSEPVLS